MSQKKDKKQKKQARPWGCEVEWTSSLNNSRSSSREVNKGTLFSVVYFSRGTLPQKRVRKGTTAGPRITGIQERVRKVWRFDAQNLK